MKLKNYLFAVLSVFAFAAVGGAFAQGKAADKPDAAAAEAGKTLFQGQFGCYGCHGRDGGGGMGPSLADGTWIYGGDLATIEESITGGRPNGMPKFESAATPEQIVQLANFVYSLSHK